MERFKVIVGAVTAVAGVGDVFGAKILEESICVVNNLNIFSVSRFKK